MYMLCMDGELQPHDVVTEPTEPIYLNSLLQTTYPLSHSFIHLGNTEYLSGARHQRYNKAVVLSPSLCRTQCPFTGALGAASEVQKEAERPWVLQALLQQSSFNFFSFTWWGSV